MRIILRTMDLPGKSAALYRPRKSPISEENCYAPSRAKFKACNSISFLHTRQTTLNMKTLHCEQTFSNIGIKDARCQINKSILMKRTLAWSPDCSAAR